MTDLADLERLELYLGSNTLVTGIEDELVARVVARRRQPRRRSWS